jgi:hypothetical protein
VVVSGIISQFLLYGAMSLFTPLHLWFKGKRQLCNIQKCPVGRFPDPPLACSAEVPARLVGHQSVLLLGFKSLEERALRPFLCIYILVYVTCRARRALCATKNHRPGAIALPEYPHRRGYEKSNSEGGKGGQRFCVFIRSADHKRASTARRIPEMSLRFSSLCHRRS